MEITKESHLDHGLTEDQVRWVAERFADKAAFFIETVQLPEELGTVACGLHGPVMGDAPVPDAETYRAVRAGRQNDSRMTWRYPRQTRLVTVIAGPDGDAPCVLYTAYGGPQAPQEPGDPDCRDVAASTAFWAEHALSGGLRNGTPHELTLVLADGRKVVLPPTGTVPRVAVENHPSGFVESVPVVTAHFGAVTGLPPIELGVVWVVSGMVLDAARSRPDVFAPGDPVRDADGKIIGAKGLRR